MFHPHFIIASRMAIRWQPRSGFVSHANSSRGGPPGYYQYQLFDFAFSLAVRREQLLQARYAHFVRCRPAHDRPPQLDI